MYKINVIGMDGSPLSEQQLLLLPDCGLIVASARLSMYVDDVDVPCIPITPMEKAFTQIEQALQHTDVAVLASGDPLFYGIGTRIMARFGTERVHILPALSSMQLAFARFKMAWNDAAIVSLHGRRTENLAGLLLANRKTCVFTDGGNSPDRIAAALLDYLDHIEERRLAAALRLYVGEELGTLREKISTGSLAEIAGMHFSNLNVLCLVLPEDMPVRPRFGLQEDEIAHSRGLITKDEIRAATLHRLRLPRDGVFWDIGGGSGSISIEAAAMLPRLNIFTIEQKEEELANIRGNIRRFGLFNILPVAGKAPDNLIHLPTPDAVFVGGSGGELERIIACTADRLQKGGTVVVNGVTEKTVSLAPQLLLDHGFTVDTSTIAVQRTGPHGSLSFNPITIMVGTK
ncbi:MAG: precorrin-6y C5,15-methyltransferase (decarboxylating) subunit CbiE [Desulfopila sp.]|jgi:precorrin-6Y C5,15-methyltransferase (decarboxylating)|nr:precorrin-6y C5,15-methyltransferase (decarboxylating) subunit CbiE [Desulfopila sp.]